MCQIRLLNGISQYRVEPPPNVSAKSLLLHKYKLQFLSEFKLEKYPIF
jgi:hypothetical protein